MRSFKYVIVYLVIIQLVLPFLIPLNWVYNYRMDYEIVKNRIEDLDGVLEQISRKIKKQGEKNYLVILGDSVAYSGPGQPEQSISYYLSEIATREGKKLPVYNLALPAMQTGDIYTVLLKLEEYGIRTDNLIINLVYSGFVERNPDPPSVFWLERELKRLDPVAYSQVADNLAANKGPKKGLKQTFVGWEKGLSSFLYRRLSLLRYKDYLFSALVSIFQQNRPEDPYAGKPWFEKEFLWDLLKQPEYQKGFSDRELVMEENNPQIYFLNRIISRQEDKTTLIFLAPVNSALMQDNVNKPGYRKNLQLIDHFFADKPVAYLNLHDAVSQELFSDHVHLIPEGYSYLSDLLWEKIEELGMIN
jgi:hypothetical protein